MNHGHIQTELESCSLASLSVVFGFGPLKTSASYKAMPCPWLLCDLLLPGKLYKSDSVASYWCQICMCNYEVKFWLEELFL